MKFGIALIIDQQKNSEKAKQIAELIRNILEVEEKPVITKYEKLKDSYKVELKGELERLGYIENAIKLTDRICSPWLIYYRDEKEVELIFNRDNHTRFRNQKLKALRWANFTVFEL